MKTAIDPRHRVRRTIIKQLFADSFVRQSRLSKTSKKILASKNLLDQKIKKAASAWPIEKLNKVDLAILRLAVYELEMKKTPPKVIIDEAVELAKEFGSENTPSFVNGVLGTIYKNKDGK